MFFKQIVRFNDVIPNYIMALGARLSIPNPVYSEQAKRPWVDVIREKSSQLYRYISAEIEFPYDVYAK